MAGYSGTPLVKKLGLKEGSAIQTIGAPPGYRVLNPSVNVPRNATMSATSPSESAGGAPGERPKGGSWSTLLR